MRLKGSVGYLDASYDEFEFEGLDLTDLDIPFASEWQLGGRALFDQPLGSGATITYAVSVHCQTDAEMSPFDPNAATGTNPKFAGATARHPTYTQLEVRVLLDANVTYTSSASVPSSRIAESVTFALNSAEYCFPFAMPMGSNADWLHLNVLFKFPGSLLVDPNKPLVGLPKVFRRDHVGGLIRYSGRRCLGLQW